MSIVRAVDSLLRRPILERYRCYRVWTSGDLRSRFMTSVQLRYHLGLPAGEELPDQRVSMFERSINWERVTGGATVDQLVDWNLKGEQ